MPQLRIALAIFAALMLLSGYAPARSDAQATVTEELFMPNGITMDLQGNILVHSDGGNTTLITRVNPTGTILDEGEIGDDISAPSFVSSRLATNPATDPNPGTVLVSPEGEIYDITPTLGNVFRCGIQTLPIMRDRVFDIQTRTSGPFTFTPPTTFGDIAVFGSDLFITGVSGNRPFVMRLTRTQTGCMPARVILTSSAASTEELPRGVAVAVAADGVTGTVMTTLPSTTSPSGCPDAVVTFLAGNPGTADFLPNGQGIPSLGMTTDDANNIYIATGGGTADCAQRDVVRISNVSGDFGMPTRIPLMDFRASRSQDVAALSGSIYVTISDFDAVVVLPD